MPMERYLVDIFNVIIMAIRESFLRLAKNAYSTIQARCDCNEHGNGNDMGGELFEDVS